MTQSAISMFCNFEIIGSLALIIVLETLIIIIQQIIIITKGVQPQ